MSHIIQPANHSGEIDSVSNFLEHIEKWSAKHKPSNRGFHDHPWFRGHSEPKHRLEPGVYRDNFSTRSKAEVGTSVEDKRLSLERQMITEFRTSGATFLDPNALVSLYFLAQHHGMPTRLLDWSTNPLAALFFASDKDGQDGEIFVMEPTQMIPTPRPKSKDPLEHVYTMRHPLISEVISMTFWKDPKELAVSKQPCIFPVRPDNQLGRIGQQSSCFTLHTHESADRDNPTLCRFKVLASKKATIREQLHHLNINQFTIYNDLDHLSKEIKRSWEIKDLHEK